MRSLEYLIVQLFHLEIWYFEKKFFYVFEIYFYSIVLGLQIFNPFDYI